jgi:hypothetical protein
MTTPVAAFVATATALLLSSISAAAPMPVYWTPVHMSKALIALQYPHPGTFSGACRGTTKARKGTYAGFRCVMNWQDDGPPLTSGEIIAWAKPLAHGRVCGSTISLSSCRTLAPGPLAGDPTICSDNDRVRCAQGATEVAIVAKRGIQVNLACMEGSSVYVWECKTAKGSYVVTWSKGVSEWTATVTP